MSRAMDLPLHFDGRRLTAVPIHESVVGGQPSN